MQSRKYRRTKRKHYKRSTRHNRNDFKMAFREYLERFKVFWDEWGLSLDDFLGLIAALGVLIVLPCIVAIIGSMFLA